VPGFFDQHPLPGVLSRARPAKAGLAVFTAAAFIGRRAAPGFFDLHPLSGVLYRAGAPARLKPGLLFGIAAAFIGRRAVPVLFDSHPLPGAPSRAGAPARLNPSLLFGTAAAFIGRRALSLFSIHTPYRGAVWRRRARPAKAKLAFLECGGIIGRRAAPGFFDPHPLAGVRTCAGPSPV
jgi:hypothetical protein